jgi:putative resolvase
MSEMLTLGGLKTVEDFVDMYDQIVNTIGMKLSQWARKNGLSYRTAFRLFQTGKLPCRSEQLLTGTILVHEEVVLPARVVIYGRVSSSDQKDDLDRQMSRLRDYCGYKGWCIAEEIKEIGSGLNGKRRLLLKLLADKTVTHIVVEHRDRLARFGSEMVEACLAGSARHLIVINESDFKDDIVQDFVDVVTSMCARIYGKRSAKNKARKMLEAAKE